MSEDENDDVDIEKEFSSPTSLYSQMLQISPNNKKNQN